MEYLNYNFPNEHVEWTIMIVLYPYISGIVAGSYLLSSLVHLFEVKSLQPIGRLAVLVSVAFGAFTTLPLLLHLGQPDRSFFLMIRPNLTSAMSAFGYIYFFYMLIVTVELWILFRPLIIDKAKTAKVGIVRLFYRIAALNVLEMTPGAKKVDFFIKKLLMVIGIPSACVLTGYVGFIFGSIKANPWWSSPMMPLIFILSGFVSGVGIVIMLYHTVCWVRKEVPDQACIRTLGDYLFGFLAICVTLEELEIIQKAYEGKENWAMIQGLLSGPLEFSFYTLQMMVGSVIPLVLLGAFILFRLHNPFGTFLVLLSAHLVQIQVLSMRFNIIIGGQLLSKSGVGYHDYHWHIWGREGLVASVSVLVLISAFIFLLMKVFPPREADVLDEKLEAA